MKIKKKNVDTVAMQRPVDTIGFASGPAKLFLYHILEQQKMSFLIF